MSRDVISNEAWAVIGPLFPSAKSTGRPPVDRRAVVEAAAWRFRAGAPWRDIPERFGNWNTIYKSFNRWSQQGVWVRALEKRSRSRSRPVIWIGSRRSTPRSSACISTARHFRAPRAALSNYKKFGDEPADHAIGRSRGGLTTKSHLVCDGKGRALAFVLTPGQSADTRMLTATLSEIRASSAHTWTVIWGQGETVIGCEGRVLRRIEQAPDYPLFLMIDLFEIGPHTGSYPKSATIHHVRAWQ